MEGKDLKDLGKYFKENDLIELLVEYEGNKIHLKKESSLQPEYVPVQKVQQPVITKSNKPIIKDFQPDIKEETEDKNVKIIKSPISGTYYSSPSPTQPAFIKIGDRVNNDTVLCIIEAMKIMNEIKAECSGIVKDILVRNEENVLNDTPLIKIDLKN